jgi:hypothetical protein
MDQGQSFGGRLTIQDNCLMCGHQLPVSYIMNHLDNHNLLYPLQHGFRSKVSCETQLLTFTQEIFDSMASGNSGYGACVD